MGSEKLDFKGENLHGLICNEEKFYIKVECNKDKNLDIV